VEYVSPHASTLHPVHFTAKVQPRIGLPQCDNLGFEWVGGLQYNSRSGASSPPRAEG
jgi:hypothetical protein